MASRRSGTYTGRHQYESPRQAITYVCDTMSTTSVPVSWRVNGNGTLDAGPESNLFVTTPQCLITGKGTGEDMSMRALPGSFDVTRDAEDYTTRVVLLAEGDGTSIATGAADISPATSYKDIHGNAVRLTRLVSESDTSTSNASTRAQLQLNRFTSTRNELRLSTSDYDIHGTFSVGDRVWVYSPEAGIVDTANEIVFRGQRLNPMKLQVTETSRPVTSGYTVAYRATDGTWMDLTDYVAFEGAGSVSVTVGDFSRQLSASGTEPVGSRPNADTSVPGVPTLIEPFTGMAYLDSRGFTRARVIVSWNAPLNTDNSTIIDGDHYELRWAVDTDMIYPATWTQVSQIRWADMQTWAQPFAAPDGQWQTMVVAWDQTTAQLQDLSPGVGYDVQIRAVDKAGNTGAWSGTTTFVASADNIPPSTPAAPTVAASRIAVQVTHTLGKASSGGTYNLESDLHHLEIHVDYEPTFTPSESTLKGKASATAGMIQAQIPVVVTVPVEETSARYVRVVAVDITGNKSGPSDAATTTALLIDDAHISDLTVTKVTAGTISADSIVGARIKTADTGARAEMSSSGISAYNSAGTRTFFADASTGDVSIIGQLVSGTSGKRLEINPTATFLPEIRFYPNSGSDFGFINGVSSGSDVAVGINSSPFDDGTGVQVVSRAFLATSGGARLETIRADTEAARGAFVIATAGTGGTLFAGYESGGVTGGYITASATLTTIGWNNGSSSTNYHQYESGGATRHIGVWRDYVSASADEGIFTGHVSTNGGTGVSLSYGPTMTSTPRPVVTVYDDIDHQVRLSAESTTGFTVTINPAGSGFWDVNFWCFRV
ncbi:fibronectin type III domain-containing protein [Streptomyces triculaminicus]|uniref:Fibronectin type III domain-containing protein n=1 Tax=Streptomyces triculaminicus TaxID=2816232 RepID=A0A939JMI5_9ACTN|nr:fibronectin type III domain-containing protein [Streptomyces triculaminicus]MBO0654236.1 fibronectin type III domain-containing protein [Streptomyces triculaminicus]